MNYFLGPDGSGPFPCAAALSSHSPGAATTTATAVVGQFLNEPMGVQAFNATGGSSSPVWSQWPETTDVDVCWTAAGSAAGLPAGAVDAVIIQYSAMQFEKAPRPCVIQGMVTAGPAASAAPAWTHAEASCIPGTQASTDYLGYSRDVAVTPDGRTVVAALRVNCTSGCYAGDELLLGLDAARSCTARRCPAARWASRPSAATARGC